MTFLLPLAGAWILGACLLLADGRRPLVCALASVGLAAVAASDLALLLGHGSHGLVAGGWPAGIGIRLRADRLSLVFAAVSSAVLAAVMAHESRAAVRSRLFPALLLLLAAGLHGVFFTGDLFNLYVFFELAVVSSFALAAYGYGRAEVRGAFVYVSLNLLGTVLFLMGVAALYHARGTLDLAQIAAERRGPEEALLLPAALLFAAFALKVGLFPFHAWTPVLYGHARPAVAAAMSGALVNVGSYALLRLGHGALADARAAAAPVLVVLGAAAIVYGALLALRRRQPAEVVAYASVVQAGYVVLALGIGGAAGVAALLLAVLSGSLDKAAMFLSLDGRGAVRATAAGVAAVGVAGLPVTLGFVAKIWLFHAALAGPLPGLATAALASSSVLLLEPLVRVWRRADGAPPRGATRGGAGLVLAAASVALGVLAAPLLELLASVGGELLAGQRP